jgi:hypothetical protein
LSDIADGPAIVIALERSVEPFNFAFGFDSPKAIWTAF